MADSTLTLSDLDQHIVTFGIDVHPPVEISSERTHLNMFYEEVKDAWPELFEQISASDTEFKISKKFRQKPQLATGLALPVDTFELVPRGPLMRFPLVLRKPIGATLLERDFESRFHEVRKLFFKHLPTRVPLRVGLVRDLVFSTGSQRCESLLDAPDQFAGANLKGGGRRFVYSDSKCNILLYFEPVQAITVTQLPVGHTVTTPGGFGLHVTLDVGSAEIRPLQETDIEEVLARASSLWPDELLNFLNGRAAR